MRMIKKLIAIVLSAVLTCSSLTIQGIGTSNVFAEEEVTSEFEIYENGMLQKYDETGGYEEQTKCNFTPQMIIEGDVAIVTIKLDGDCSSFNFGLMYDADIMEYADWDMTDEFYSAFVEKAGGIVMDSNLAEQSYVVFAGQGDYCTFNGEALIFKFNIKGKATPIKIVKDSKYILDSYRAAGAEGTLEEFLVSDKAPVDAPKAVEVKPTISVPTDPVNPNPGDDVNDFTIDENGVLTKYNGDGGDVAIPEGVTSIGYGAFSNCYSLTSVTIPDGVLIIDNSAFWCCNNLTSVTIPESVIEIGDQAFGGCDSLINITIPDGVEIIGYSVFGGCDSLTSVIISKSVISIDYRVFAGCSSLTSITVDDENSKYDSRENCNAIIETENNKLIAGCPNTVIPVGVTEIGDQAFYGCSSLKSITIPDGVIEIGYSAFNGCSDLTSITISEGLTSIDHCAFEGCRNLANITIPEGVTEIGAGAFSNCSSLTNIKIPKSVKYINNLHNSFYTSNGHTLSAFSGCSGLTSITVDKGNSKYDSREGCNAIIETESNTLIAGCKNTVIPKGVTEIGSTAFKDCSSLSSITIPDGVTKIGEEAFMSCLSLTEITIPDGVTSIGDNAFYLCNRLISITIPDSVTNIGGLVFKGTKWLEDRQAENPIVTVNNIVVDGRACCGNVEIPAGVTGICNSAFEFCSGLTSITIPAGVTIIGESAFHCCSSLTSIKIPDGVTEIGKYAFDYCSSLTSVTIPESVTKIGRDAFKETKWFEDKQKENPLVILDNIVIDGQKCEGEVEVPKGVRMIADYAFDDCASLESVIIPDGVTYIGDGAFYDCSSLTNVTIPDGVTSIGALAFYDCKSLTTSITIPESVTGIGSSAFWNSSVREIKGKKGSYAETYAKDHGFRFVDIDGGNTGDDGMGDDNTDDNNLLMGDLNGDKKVNLNDAKMLLRAAVGIIILTDEQQKVADINNDQKINLNDAKMLLRIAVGIAN